MLESYINRGQTPNVGHNSNKHHIMLGLSTPNPYLLFFVAIVLEGFFYGKIVCYHFHGLLNCVGPGIYSAIFAVYFQYHVSQKDTQRRTTIIHYSLYTLYVLSGVLIAADITTIIVFSPVSHNSVHNNNKLLHAISCADPGPHLLYPLYYGKHNRRLLWLHCTICPSTHKSCLATFNQKSFTFSKIYRCWIVWNRNIRVVIIPSILTFAFLGRPIYLHLLICLNLFL